MRSLLEVPQIIGVALGGRRWNKDYLGAVQSQRPRAFGEMAVVADVDSDPRVFSFKGRKTEVARGEVKLLPKSGKAMRYVSFSIFAQVLSVGVDHGGSVVINPSHLFFVDWHYHHHPMLPGDLAHQLSGWAIWNALYHLVPSRILLGGEVGSVE